MYTKRCSMQEEFGLYTENMLNYGEHSLFKMEQRLIKVCHCPVVQDQGLVSCGLGLIHESTGPLGTGMPLAQPSTCP